MQNPMAGYVKSQRMHTTNIDVHLYWQTKRLAVERLLPGPVVCCELRSSAFVQLCSNVDVVRWPDNTRSIDAIDSNRIMPHAISFEQVNNTCLVYNGDIRAPPLYCICIRLFQGRHLQNGGMRCNQLPMIV